MLYAIWYGVLGIVFLILSVIDVLPISRETLLSLGVAFIAIAFAFLVQREDKKEAKDANAAMLKELQDIKNDLAEIKRSH